MKKVLLGSSARIFLTIGILLAERVAFDLIIKCGFDNHHKIKTYHTMNVNYTLIFILMKLWFGLSIIFSCFVICEYKDLTSNINTQNLRLCITSVFCVSFFLGRRE